MILALDPGIHGAFAWCEAEFLIDLADMPTTEVRGKHKIDTRAVCELMAMRDVSLIVIEQGQSMPRQGITSAFNYGFGAGVLEGVAIGLGLPIEMVRPAAWKKASGTPADKGASLQMPSRFWPGKAQDFRRVKDDGRADAALLGRWAATRKL
jgi:crossover junction endodeoxyribonuclease RuvC